MKKIPSKRFLYVIFAGRDIPKKLVEILNAGVEVLQLRDKGLSTKELINLGKRAKDIIRDRALFFLNDRFDIALAVGADGVHLGQDDVPVEAVRKVTEKDFLIGLSTHTLKEVRESIHRPVDYISFGPVFKTLTKTDALSPRGIHRLKRAVSASLHPVVAVGGISKENIDKVLETGVKGVAISGGILQRRDAYKAALEVKEKL